MATKRENVFVWGTWLPKIMAGDQACEWASWFKAHFENYPKARSDFDTAKWKIEHTRRLRELRMERQSLGERVFLESENEIRYQTASGITLVGRPDLIAISASGPTIYDIKTGQQRASDQIQVLIYMYLLPLTVAAYAGTRPAGCVVYKETRIEIPANSVDEKFAEDFKYFLEIVGSPEAPAKVPSAFECRYCDIPKTECPERIDA